MRMFLLETIGTTFDQTLQGLTQVVVRIGKVDDINGHDGRIVNTTM